MNIAIVTDTYFPDINGVTSSIYTLAESLRTRGHNVYVFTVSEPKEELRKLKADPCVYRFPSVPLFFLKPHRAVLPFSVKLIRMMRKLKIDIIHTQSEFFMGFVGLYVGISMHIPIIHTYHTMLEEYTHYIAGGKLATPRMARKFSGTFCNLVDSVIVPTQKVEKSLISYHVKRPLYVIPTGIDLEPFHPNRHSDEEILRLKHSLGIDPKHRLILCLGRVAREKSIDIIISNLSQIVRRIPDIRLLIVGDGPALSELKELSVRLGVSQFVYFAGPAPYSEIAKFYRLGDIFISCSVTETQGLTYYEAMASGLPVVARIDDSISSLLIDNQNCRLFRDGHDIPEIVDSILSDPEVTHQYSRMARESVEIYSASTFAERVEDAYRNTIDRTRLKRTVRKQEMFRVPASKVFQSIKLVSPSNFIHRNASDQPID